jgi:hypothetical protein
MYTIFIVTSHTRTEARVPLCESTGLRLILSVHVSSITELKVAIYVSTLGLILSLNVASRIQKHYQSCLYMSVQYQNRKFLSVSVEN